MLSSFTSCLHLIVFISMRLVSVNFTEPNFSCCFWLLWRFLCMSSSWKFYICRRLCPLYSQYSSETWSFLLLVREKKFSTIPFYGGSKTLHITLAIFVANFIFGQKESFLEKKQKNNGKYRVIDRDSLRHRNLNNDLLQT